MDDQVNPDYALRLVAADKNFELRIVPGAEHIYIDCLAYVRKVCWDFLVHELMGTPPPGYRPAPIPVDPGLLASLSPEPDTRQLRARLGSLPVPVPPGGPAGPGRAGAG